MNKTSRKLPKVFLVEDYEPYESSTIEAAFDTRKEAERFCERRNKGYKRGRYIILERRVRES